jgi:hypothetical protein
MDISKLYVITMISNPVRYRSRYELYRKFSEVMKQAGANLITIELAFGARPFEITERDNPMHVQLRTIDELWHKENALNIAINYVAQIDPDAKYIAWIDADVLPMRPTREWLEETVHELQHYQFVQMFETAIDLDPNHSMIGTPAVGFMAQYVKSGYRLPNKGGFWEDYYDKQVGHPGYAWAANIDALTHVGNLIDFSILGAGDRHMALGLIGCMDQSFGTRGASYIRKLLEWQGRAERWVKRDVGFVRGSIFHFWHGAKQNRQYVSRWKILTENQYNPETDIKPDHQGLFQLETWTPRQMMLRDQIRSYFRQRNEDSVDVDVEQWGFKEIKK